LVLKGVKQPDIYGALRKGAQVQQAVEPAHTNISELKRQTERAKAKRRKVAPAPRDFSAGTKQRTTAILDSAMKERSQDMKKEQVRRASREEDEPHMRARRGQGKMRIPREISERSLVPTSHKPYSDIKHLLPTVTHAEGVKAKSDWDRKMERTRAANIGGSVPAGPAASIMSREDTRKQRELDVWTEKNKRRLAAGEQALPKPTFDAPRAPTPVQARRPEKQKQPAPVQKPADLPSVPPVDVPPHSQKSFARTGRSQVKRKAGPVPEDYRPGEDLSQTREARIQAEIDADRRKRGAPPRVAGPTLEQMLAREDTKEMGKGSVPLLPRASAVPPSARINTTRYRAKSTGGIRAHGSVGTTCTPGGCGLQETSRTF
jgi:hypothetical protein